MTSQRGDSGMPNTRSASRTDGAAPMPSMMRQLRWSGRRHQPVAHADAGHEAAKHQRGVVAGETHDQGADEEKRGRNDDGESAADPVGRPPRREGADERVEIEDAHHDL